ncbi:hypothetical protein DRF57_00125 [Chryseobacterium rhizosphaerae]|uniref:RHS repeat-associated core domain-containing protein n=1 Tax=Chryseobacterium rhizosphaerae TaxID=395937 RepID=A0ABX9IRP5_9FLAO|nr:hypothetical protein DRF57_00125 [Chryseobacterium rhizosphaerae]GEN65964.1 hypothetical protein CRH01_05320 [Chryseobacterium rhizosphaerae]
MYDYGWGQYMPDLGRWNGMDKLAEKYYSTSPNAYVMNNPVMSFDPDGREIKFFGGGIDPSTTIYGGDYSGISSFSPFGGYSGMSGGLAFGKTQAYGDLMNALQNGGDFSLKTHNGYMSWWTGGAAGNANTSQEMIAHMMKLAGSVQRDLTDIANNQYFSAGHLIASESVARFGAYSLSKALKPDYSVNYTVLDDAAKPYRITTMAGIKLKPATAATLSKFAKYGGVALAVVSIGATELQYADGQIGETERIMNHMMTGVGMIPTPWTIGAGLVYGVVTGGYQAVTGRSIFNDIGFGPQKK